MHCYCEKAALCQNFPFCPGITGAHGLVQLDLIDIRCCIVAASMVITVLNWVSLRVGHTKRMLT